MQGRASEPQVRAAVGPRARRFFTGWAIALGLVLVAEAALRCAGLPAGIYLGSFARAGLWEPGFSGVLRSGPLSYRVEANAQGFRGPPLRTGRDAADVRVVCIGDSLTQGFYVDNESTYPSQLGRALAALGQDVEVINAAHGAGSMDRFTDILRELVLPLEPDLVLVTFVSNDLGELGWFPLEVEGDDHRASLASFFVSRTAIGESLMRLLLRWRAPGHRPGAADEELGGDERYRIEGNADYAANVRVFEERYSVHPEVGDGLAIAPELSVKGRAAFELYFSLLKEFRDLCRSQGIRLLFLYMPAYPELYAKNHALRRTPGKDLLLQELTGLGIAFLDLTDPLREASREGPLHLAPVDFHLNPRGLGVVAKAIAGTLVERGLLRSTEEGR